MSKAENNSAEYWTASSGLCTHTTYTNKFKSLKKNPLNWNLGENVIITYQQKDQPIAGESALLFPFGAPLIQDTHSRSLSYEPHTANVTEQIPQQPRGNFPRNESSETSVHHETVWKTGLQPGHTQCGASGLLCWPYKGKGLKDKTQCLRFAFNYLREKKEGDKWNKQSGILGITAVGDRDVFSTFVYTKTSTV